MGSFKSVEAEAEQPSFAHYSTGRLTPTQAELVDLWRARLLEDRPLPGRQPVGEALRLAGIDDRPRASCSNVIAAAVLDLLGRNAPAGLELARYAEASRTAAVRGAPDAPTCLPVSFYLPADVAERAEELRAKARQDMVDAHNELWHEAEHQFPTDTKQQVVWFRAEIARRGLPANIRQVPRGAIARMAIDRWVLRSADSVVADAVVYAADAHLQVHRARRDMRQLRS